MKNLMKAFLFISVVILFAGCPGETPPPTATATPVISPETGIYSYGQEITITCSTADAVIYYTTATDAAPADPTAESTAYTGAIDLSGHGSTLYIKAAAQAPDLSLSAVAGATIEIDYATFPYIAGAITTGGGVNIDNVKVGLFYKTSPDGDNAGTNSYLNDDINQGTDKWRVYHDDASVTNGTDTPVAPTRLGYVDTTAKTYILSIPEDPPARSGVDWSDGYYALAWYDTDDDDILDLVDGPVADQAANNEYNRMPSKTITLNGNPDVSCYVDFIEQDELDTSGYQFKYYNAADENDYDHISLTSSDTGDFDFNIADTTDTP